MENFLAQKRRPLSSRRQKTFYMGKECLVCHYTTESLVLSNLWKLWKNYVNNVNIITGFIFLIKHKLYIYIIISLIPNNDLILILTLFWNRQFLYFHILIPSFSVISFWEILKWNFPYNLYSNQSQAFFWMLNLF